MYNYVMKVNYSYIAVTIEENNKFYSYVLKINDNDNLVSKLNIKNINYATLCKTKKQAYNLVENWNNNFKVNQTYMFDESF